MKLKFILIRVIIALFIVLAVILLVLPFAAHKIIENKSENLIGRKITIGDLDLNYATVTISIDDFVLYEENGTDPFVSFKTLRINMEPWKLLKKEYALSEFFWDGLHVSVNYDGEKFNFDDLIAEQDSTTTEEPSNKEKKEIQFSIENINIVNGSYVVEDTRLNNTISGTNLNLNIPILAWNNRKSEAGFNIDFGRQGGLSIDADFDQKAKEYWVKAQVDSMLINPLAGYISSYINTSDIHGIFHNSFNIHGSLGENANVVVSGNASLKDLVLNDNKGDSIFKIEELYIRLDSVDVLNQYYHVGAVKLIEPFIHYEKFDSVHNNISELIASPEPDSSSVAEVGSVDAAPNDTTYIVETDSIDIKEDAENPMIYLVDSLLLVNGEVSFIDKSLDRNFYYKLDKINVSVTDIDNTADRIPAAVSMRFQEEGELKITAGFSIKNPLDIDASIDLRKLDMVSFSPYSEYFISRPVHQGRMVYSGDVEMTRDTIIVQNDFWMRELEFGELVNNEKRINTPIRLALNILKDKNDNVEMHVPINGNPSDPDFDTGKIIWGTFSGFFGKIAAKPKKIRPHLFGKNPNKIEKIKLELAQQELIEKNKKILEHIDKIFKKEDRKQSRKKKEIEQLYFVLTQEPLIEKEKKELAVQIICLEYMLKELKPVSQADSLKKITKLLEERNTNSGLIKYMNKIPVKPENLGFEDKCVALVGDDKLTNQMYALIKKRNEAVKKYLLEDLEINKSRVEVRTTDLLNYRPEFDVPIFRVESGVIIEKELSKKD